jgi:polar amino acid transport system substrate-binding protein
VTFNLASTRALRYAGALGGIALVALALSLSLPAQARSLEEVKARGRISLCGHPDALPFASEKADPPGFQVEIGRAIAEQLGVSLEMLWIKPRYRANLVNCDMMLDNISDQSLYEGKLLLSRPYHRTGIALGVNGQFADVKAFDDFKPGQKIGVMVGSLAQTVLGKRGLTTSPYAFEEDMLEDLAKGDLAGAAVSPGRLAWYIRNHPASGVRLVHAYDGEPQLAWSVAAGFRKSDQALVDSVNAVLGRLLEDGTIAGIYQKYGLEHRAP